MAVIDKMEEIEMNIGMYLIVILGALIGGIPTLFITLGIPAVMVWKLYRKVRYNIAITD